MEKLVEVNQTLSRPALERLLKRRVTGRDVEELGAYWENPVRVRARFIRTDDPEVYVRVT